MLSQAISLNEIVLIIVYLGIVGYLGWLGWRRTKTASDYLVAGRGTHPFVMAMSYGATFISTSAIVGFGGVAAMFGMSLLWLVAMNIIFGIFVAFVIFGGRTRKVGHRLNAHTFPELLGRRYQSRFIQVFAGLIIFLFIPLYASAVLIGGCEFITAKFDISFEVSLAVFSIIIAAYVVTGGLKGVMYTEAFQGTIMFFGMLILLFYTYSKVGGLVEGQQFLTDLAPLVPEKLQAMGHNGWTAFPKFGFGAKRYDLWWLVVSTFMMGVGIGVLAQPQLVVRFMTVKSQMELNRGVLIGGLFILVIPGTAYVVGSLSNAYFVQHGRELTGRVVETIDADKGFVRADLLQAEGDGWQVVSKSPVPMVIDPETTAQLADGDDRVVKGTSIALVYAGGNSDQIMPTFIVEAMPPWFGLLFMLTLLAAAMSTLASQFHALGTSIGRDVYEQVAGSGGRSINITRVGIILGIIMAVIFSYYARSNREWQSIVARATAIFFGLCSSTFLPAYLGGIFTRRMTKAAAIASMFTGFGVTAFWLTFIKAKEAGSIGLVQKLTGGADSLLAGHANWPMVDPIVIALPLSILAAVVISLLSKPAEDAHLARCFGTEKK